MPLLKHQQLFKSWPKKANIHYKYNIVIMKNYRQLNYFPITGLNMHEHQPKWKFLQPIILIVIQTDLCQVLEKWRYSHYRSWSYAGIHACVWSADRDTIVCSNIISRCGIASQGNNKQNSRRTWCQKKECKQFFVDLLKERSHNSKRVPCSGG